MAKRKSRKRKSSNNEEALQVTQQRYDEIQAELIDRKENKRSEIAEEIDEARKLGDLSENEPYAAAMQKKDLNEARIDELEYVLNNAVIVEGGSGSKVGVGHTVEIQNLSNKQKKEVTVVGRQASQEANPREGKISIDSPMGKALENHLEGDVVEVDLPVGKVEYKIIKITG